MSAYIVENKTINRIVTYICSEAMQYDRKPLNKLGYNLPLVEAAKKLAQDMYNLNQRSVFERYEGRHGTNLEHHNFKFKELECDNPYQVFMSLVCFLYQSCEGKCDEDPLYLALEYVSGNIAGNIVRKLPEYEKCKWE